MRAVGYIVEEDPSGDFKIGTIFSKEEVRFMLMYCSFTPGTILKCSSTGNRSKIVKRVYEGNQQKVALDKSEQRIYNRD